MAQGQPISGCEFQSLTGRLKTADNDDAGCVLEEFQSLTGRLKTVPNRGLSVRFGRFNPSQVG